MRIVKHLCVLIGLLLSLNTFAQAEKNYKITCIAFYNVENLFDVKNDPKKYDEASPIMEMSMELRKKAYQNKLENISKVIAEIGKDVTKYSPAIIGLCEIENRTVVEDLLNQPSLAKKPYKIVHFESPDERGIDVALLYNKNIFKLINSKSQELVLFDEDDKKNRDYTRDQLVVSGLLDGEKMHFIINHWPSRSGGEAASRYKREKAAQLNKKIIDSLQSKNPYAKIISMGDLNDGPYNESLKTILNAKANKKDVSLKGIYNPMENLQKQGFGTIAYRDSWDLFDQILLTEPFLSEDYSSYQIYKAGIFNPNYLTTPSGKYKGYPYRSFSNGSFSGGYSDHFPVYVYLVKEKE
ncbi:endonuclease/exonuclease/phosphatase family protein [Mesonia aquimarina]|uniref:endonuclease/exonuclease/phosphatase family protein n=1 Tax=Mesonia aquimarina TaxID=1504967 RepID=UPI000EF5742B|nr:endonuclease/exonuclease/phosphatase family protein [Mesonia aquimarina]